MTLLHLGCHSDISKEMPLGLVWRGWVMLSLAHQIVTRRAALTRLPVQGGRLDASFTEQHLVGFCMKTNCGHDQLSSCTSISTQQLKQLIISIDGILVGKPAAKKKSHLRVSATRRMLRAAQGSCTCIFTRLMISPLLAMQFTLSKLT